MPNKNAYEIRLDVLQMAHSDAQMKYLEKLNVSRDTNGKVQNTELIDDLFPNPSDIIKRAEELYTFVENNNI